VIVRYPYSESDSLALLAHDDDPFNRWEAGQRLAVDTILNAQGHPSPAFIEALRHCSRIATRRSSPRCWRCRPKRTWRSKSKSSTRTRSMPHATHCAEASRPR
jgi:hypothetical protein